MRVGTVRERKDGEARVGLTPEGVFALATLGHEVLVEAGAGEGSGHFDAAYIASGAKSLPAAAEVWSSSDLVVKVKEPVQSEYAFLRPGCALFTYLHLAADRPLTERLMASRLRLARVRARAQAPMARCPCSRRCPRSPAAWPPKSAPTSSSIPARASGKLLGGVAGVPPGRVVIIGSGTVATAAARVLMGLDAQRHRDVPRPRPPLLPQENFGGRIATRISCPRASPKSCAAPTSHPRRARPRRRRAEGRHPRDGALHGPRRRHRRRLHRPGRRRRNEPPHHPQRPHLHRRGRHPLLRQQHARRRPQTSTQALTSATLPYVEALADHGVAGASSPTARSPRRSAPARQARPRPGRRDLRHGRRAEPVQRRPLAVGR